MRIFKRFNTILFKLSASYVLITLISVLLTGIFANLGFQYYFNKQIINSNKIVLSDMQDFIDKDVFTKVEQIYLALVAENMENGLFNEMLQKNTAMNYDDMNNMKKLLSKQQVLNSEWLSNMAVYFVDADLVISSSGILYQHGEPESRRPIWLNGMISGKSGFAYYPTRSYETSDYLGQDEVCMLIRPYPIRVAENEARAYIAFGVREIAFKTILQQTSDTAEENVSLIVDRQGNIISTSNNMDAYQDILNSEFCQKLYTEEEEDVHNENDTESNYIRKINGVEYVFSYYNIDKYQWRLINFVPKSLFFKASRYLWLVVIAVCILTILLGLLISNFFTRSIYNPLKSIVNSARQALGRPTAPDADEYVVINQAIGEIENYEKTIQDNRLLIKYNMIQGLTHQRIRCQKELDGVLKLCNSSFSGNQFTTVLFTMNRALLQELTVENSRFILYSMIEMIEGMSGNDATYFAVERDSYSVMMIAAYQQGAYKAAIKDAQYISDYVFSNYYMTTFAVIGKVVSEPTALHLSWQSVKDAMEYRIFMSRMSVLCSDEILKRENNQEVIPERYFSNLAAQLNGGRETESKKQIHEIITAMVCGPYSAAHCNAKLLEMISIISKFLHEHNIKTEDIDNQKFETIFYSMEDVYEIEAWSQQVITDAFVFLKNRKENMPAQLAEKAKEYIQNHLEEELSLRSVAENIYISPTYLSKIFKEEAGVNFSDYVTQVRMSKAANLLLHTNQNIEVIAQKVGYNTPHYFIKKFRECYGTTPKNYRFERNE